MANIQWLTPEYAVWAVIPVIIAVFWYFRHGFSLAISTGRYHAFRHPLAHLLTAQKRTASQRWLSRIIATWLVLCILLALAQPVKVGERLPDLPPERDIVLLVDVSISMTLKDYVLEGQPVSRIDMLKTLLLDQFADRLQGERLGVIIFAEKAYTWVPLTRDHNLVKSQLARLKTTMAGRVSAVGDVLTLAIKSANQQAQRQQTFVLFTDADESIGTVTPEAAAQLAKEAGISIYILAMGASSEEESLRQKNQSTDLIYQPVNLDLLTAIAKPTGGKVWQAENADTLEKTLTELAQQQRNQAKQTPRYIQHPLYSWLLLAGLLPLIFWQLYRALRE